MVTFRGVSRKSVNPQAAPEAGREGRARAPQCMIGGDGSRDMYILDAVFGPSAGARGAIHADLPRPKTAPAHHEPYSGTAASCCCREPTAATIPLDHHGCSKGRNHSPTGSKHLAGSLPYPHAHRHSHRPAAHRPQSEADRQPA